jgi:hypothetical protein
MSNIINTARGIQAICRPLTGEPAVGEVVFKTLASVPSPIIIEPGRYLFPIVSGAVRYDLIYKVKRNLNDPDGRWSVPGGGGSLPVQVMSNIGGNRHNMPNGARFQIEAPWAAGFEPKPATLSGLSGGVDRTDDLALYNFVSFESFGSKPNLELFKSSIGGRFPAALMYWENSEPADGMTTSATQRPTHRGQGKISYTEIFTILLISSRDDAEATRRAQPLRILDAMSALLVDRVGVDGQAVSSPGGLHIRRRWRIGGEDGFYRTFQVYALSVSAQATIVQIDTRTYSDLLRFKIDAPREDTPENLPLVVNNLVANPQDP